MKGQAQIDSTKCDIGKCSGWRVVWLAWMSPNMELGLWFPCSVRMQDWLEHKFLVFTLQRPIRAEMTGLQNLVSRGKPTCHFEFCTTNLVSGAVLGFTCKT